MKGWVVIGGIEITAGAHLLPFPFHQSQRAEHSREYCYDNLWSSYGVEKGQWMESYCDEFYKS